MKITLNWLRDLIEIVLPTDELCDALVMAGLEVEAVEELRPTWRDVEVAEITAVTSHANADRLRLCDMRTGRGAVRVVCGASNMQAGDKVALAPPGTILPGGRRIERATIRGQASDGMLCSARELALPEDDDGGGILILPGDAPVGTRLAEYLQAEDTVLELGITPNRGDCLSVLGIAREVAALTGVRLNVRTPRLVEEDPPARRVVRVAVEAPDLCPRYQARMMRGVRIGPSPPWLRTRLQMVGVRSINNIVDATNYVMLERGQPLHAFDLASLAEARVTARRAGSRQRFTTLDGVERELVTDDLVIADGRGPVAVAGVMGGIESEIRTATTDVMLESAFFTPETVRRTSRRLGLTSDSSYRFERGVDPAGTTAALARVVELILAVAGGRVARGVLTAQARSQAKPAPIRLRPARLNALLGTTLGNADIERPLRALGAVVSGKGAAGLRVVPPTHRFDLRSEIDLVEEVARLTGYGAVQATLPAVSVGGSGAGSQREIETQVRDTLRAAGWSEMVTLAMVAADDNRTFPGLPYLGGDVVAVVNPLSVETAELPRSPIPGLLRALDENRRHREPVVAGYSLGRVYACDGEQYREPSVLGLLLAGQWPAMAIGEATRPASFADIRGALDLVLGRLHLDTIRWERLAGEAAYLHPGKSARLSIGGVFCGVAGALHPDLVAARGLECEPWLAELDMLRVVQYCPRRVIFRPLPRFPAVHRDIAVVVDSAFQAQQILDAIRGVAEPLVEEVRVFDEYAGAPIPEGRKSLAYTISYRAPDRTLTDDEVNAVHEEIVGRLLQHLPVEVRR